MTFSYWGKYTKKEGELVLSLCSRSKGAASLTHLCQKTKKRDEKGKKETKEAKKRDHFDRVTVAEKV